MINSMLIVGLGGAIGSILRWLLGLSLNTLFPAIPLGTLFANLVACYLIGIFLAVFITSPFIAPEWRLFIITGCLGGLSTFSTFSLEVATLLQEDRIAMGLTMIAMHVIGGICMTFLGIITVSQFR